MRNKLLRWIAGWVMLVGGAAPSCGSTSTDASTPPEGAAGDPAGSHIAPTGSGGSVASSTGAGGATAGAAGNGPAAGGSDGVSDSGTRGGSGGSGGGMAVSDSGGGTPNKSRVVGYLPDYSGSFADWAKRIDFSKMTHLNLAFVNPDQNNNFGIGASDQELKALVDAAHAAGTKVIASLGGGGGDQKLIARYNAGNIDGLVTKLDQYVAAHNLDGVDVDVEDPNNLGANYSTFVSATVAKLRPEGKLVTAAVAQYLQGSMSDATLHLFDFVNIMVYSTYDDGVKALTYYAENKGVPKAELVLGAGFFGTDSSSKEYAYSDILKADANAWQKDQATVQGKTVNYTGQTSMAKITQYAKGFGDVTLWELSGDVTGAHSLYKTI